MTRTCSICLLLLGLTSAARAEEASPRTTWAADVAQVVAAHEAGDRAEVVRLARRVDPDPWLIADALLVVGRPEVALACAEGPDTARLPDYVRKQAGKAPHAALRRVIDAVGREVDPATAEALLGRIDEHMGQGGAFERTLAEIQRSTLLACLERNTEAAEACLSAARAAEQLGWLRMAANRYLEGGMLAYADLNFEGMLTAWTRQIPIEHGRGNPVGAATCTMWVGNVHVQLGDYAAAQAWFDEAIGIFRAHDVPGDLALALQNSAEALTRQGRLAEAQQRLETALDLVRGTEHQDAVADLTMRLGNVAVRLREYELALERYVQAREMFEALGDDTQIANVVGNLGLLSVHLGNGDQALVYTDQALEMLGAPKARESICAVLANKGFILSELGRLQEACTVLAEAVKLAKDIGDPALVHRALVNLAGAFLLTGERDEAIRLHEEGLTAAARCASDAMLMESHQGLAEAWLAKGDPARAFRAARRAMEYSSGLVSGLSQRHAASARGQLTGLFTVASEAAIAWGNPAALFTVLESARAGALLESLENDEEIRAAGVPPDLHRRQEERTRAVQGAVLRYQRALAAGVLRDIRKQKSELDARRTDLHDVIGRIQRTAKAAASVLYPQAAALEDVQAELGEGDAVVLYSLLGERAVALVIGSEEARIVDLGPSESLVAAASGRLDDPSTDPSPVIAALHARLIQPLALTPATRRLLISPDGLLGYVPFGALAEGRSVAFIPSATAHRLLRETRTEPGRGVLAVGDPDYHLPLDTSSAVAIRGNMVLAPLPATRREALRVGDVVLVGAQATPSGVFAALRARERWQAVHFACHGLLDVEDPLQSALALSFEESGDNLLTCADVFQRRIPADLVVLSACATGRGRIYRTEGIVGLTQAFMLAGAPRVLVSLWKVDDAATCELMTRFYGLWRPKRGPGLPPAEALAKAQAAVCAQERWRHPHYWAAWVLWGLPE